MRASRPLGAGRANGARTGGKGRHLTLGLNGSLLVIWGCTPAAVDSRAVDFQDSQGDTALGTASDTASDTAADSALDTAGEIAPEPLTGMWVWDTSVAGNPAATAELLTFSATNGVDTIT